MSGLQLGHAGRYRDIALLLWKHGREELFARSAFDELLSTGGEPVDGDEKSSPERLADDLEKLGPSFIKLGQLLSTRPDLLPPAYLDALERLQDDVEPFPYEDVRRIVEDELGVRLSKAFESFDVEPLAAASLAQVHRATLRDGREVAVKVQRPGVRERLAEDMEALGEVLEFLERHATTARRYNLVALHETFTKTLRRELDFNGEAAHLERLRRCLAEFPNIVIPAPIPDYTTSRVLTMERVRGTKINELNPLTRAELDGGALADELCRAFLKQLLVDGMFHADPHPGNVFLTEDGRIALLDLGMVGFVGPVLQEKILRLMLALSEAQGERAAEIACEIAETTEHSELASFRRRIAELVHRQSSTTVADLRTGRLLLSICRIAAETGVVVPTELAVVGKALLSLDQIGLCLDEDFDPAETVRRSIEALLAERLQGRANKAGLLGPLLEAKEFAEKLPSRLDRILDRVANNELRLRVDSIDETRLVRSMEKIANRITAGLVLASMILGACLLMRVPTSFSLFGYPGLAMIFFVAAAGGGFWLLATIFRGDRRRRPGTGEGSPS